MQEDMGPISILKIRIIRYVPSHMAISEYLVAGVGIVIAKLMEFDRATPY
jgi:hypothetical protein